VKDALTFEELLAAIQGALSAPALGAAATDRVAAVRADGALHRQGRARDGCAMIQDLKPYPAYKDSGVPWVGAIPQHWSLQRLDRLFLLRSEAPLEEDARVTGYLDGRVTLRSNVAGQKIKGVVKEAGWQRVHPGDFAISGMNAHLGGMGVSDSLGKCSPIYLVLKPKDGTNAQFVSHAVRHTAHSGALKAMVNTIRFNSADLKREDRKLIWVWIPTCSEQSAIVRFIGHAERRIRRYIGAKKKLIALLNEQKQAIIHRAVTRGLDPNVRLKPSGVEWLGDVPEHWEVRPAQCFYHEVDERSATGAEELLSVSHITGVTPRSQKSIAMFMASSYIGHKLCRPGDLVVNTMWAWMAALGVARQAGIVSPAYAVYRPLRTSGLLSEYADLLLRTRPYVSEYVCRSTGIQSSRLRLYPEQFLRIKLVCPSQQEQWTILAQVTVETAASDRAIAGAQRAIDLLREYRTRLIADVVTGKLDVREAAARLPDETNEPELLDEAEALADDDDAADDADLDNAVEEADA